MYIFFTIFNASNCILCHRRQKDDCCSLQTLYIIRVARGRDEVRFCGDARRGERAMVYIMTLYRNAKGKRKMEFRCGGPPGAAS